MRFRDLADGGRHLAPLVAPLLGPDVVIVRIGQGGLVTGAAVADALGIDVPALPTARTDAGVVVDVAVDVAGRTVVAVDDGVESGTAARAAALAIRAAGAARVVLAVPVCPVAAEASLLPAYDEVVAVHRPTEPRSLHEHYDTFA